MLFGMFLLHGLPPKVILLTSDEMEPILESLGRHAMLVLDALAWDCIQHWKNHALCDNYYVYRIGSLLKTT
jgi:hypothetical protein